MIKCLNWKRIVIKIENTTPKLIFQFQFNNRSLCLIYTEIYRNVQKHNQKYNYESKISTIHLKIDDEYFLNFFLCLEDDLKIVTLISHEFVDC